MGSLRGYYSIIQFCPSASRAEAANVGVILFCPERDFLEAKMSEGNDRLSRFFGRHSFNAKRVNDAKHAIVQRLHVDRQSFLNQEDLAQFASTRANEITLTAPRPMSIDSPADDLAALFIELVGSRNVTSSRARTSLGRELKAIFERSNLKDKVLRNESVRIPVTNEELMVPYAFRNGILNLVSPLQINITTLVEARKLAVDGDLLRKHAQTRWRRRRAAHRDRVA